MSTVSVQFDLAETADPGVDSVIECGLVGMLTFGVLAFGAVQVWAETIVMAFAFAMLGVLALKLYRRPDVPFVWSPTYWPIGVFVAFAVVQLLPLPIAFVQAISPHTFELKRQLLSDLPIDSSRWMTLSFYPEATIRDLKLLLAVIAVHIVVLNCIRRASQMRRLLAAIAIIGAAMAILALLQDASATTSIYWLIPNPTGRLVRGGPFVNRSHFGQFMNLSIGATLGLLLTLAHQHFRRHDYTLNELKHKLRAPIMRAIGGALVACVIGIASVMLSLSRGAMLSTIVAGTIVTFVVLLRNGGFRRRGGWIALAIAMLIVCVALLDYRTIADRLRPTNGDWQGNRLEILRDLLPSWKRFPYFGTGLGTFSSIFPMLDRSNWPFFATHAENEYAQTLTETGVFGLALAIAFIVIVSRAAIRAARGPMSPASSMAIGLSFGWIAILLHSFTDFGQHMPAIAMLTATTSALLLNLAQLRQRERDDVSSPLPAHSNMIWRIGALGFVALIGAVVLYDQLSAWAAERAFDDVKRIDADLQHKEWNAENAEYADVLVAAEIAAMQRPLNAEYRYWLNFYRWKSIARVRVQNGGAPLPATQRDFARRIVDALHAARALAPAYGNLSMLAGEIEYFELDQRERGRRELERAFALCGANPTSAFLLGEAQAHDGDLEASMLNLQRAASLNPDLRGDVSNVYLQQLNRPDLALEVAGDDLQTLEALTAMLEKRTDDPRASGLAARARVRVAEVVESLAAKPDAAPELIARQAAAFALQGEHERAVLAYRRALARKFGDTDWRMALARSLESLGRRSEATEEAERCLQRRPQMTEALEMLERLKTPPR